MRKNLAKILSFALSFCMIIGVCIPMFAVSAEQQGTPSSATNLIAGKAPDEFYRSDKTTFGKTSGDSIFVSTSDGNKWLQPYYSGWIINGK